MKIIILTTFGSLSSVIESRIFISWTILISIHEAFVEKGYLKDGFIGDFFLS